MDEKFKYGERLRQLRQERYMSQEDVALAADLTTSYYGQIERGTANPTVSALEKICTVLDISISDIFIEDSNLLGIDNASMQMLRLLAGQSDKEKNLILLLVKTAIKLCEEKNKI